MDQRGYILLQGASPKRAVPRQILDTLMPVRSRGAHSMEYKSTQTCGYSAEGGASLA